MGRRKSKHRSKHQDPQNGLGLERKNSKPKDEESNNITTNPIGKELNLKSESVEVVNVVPTTGSVDAKKTCNKEAPRTIHRPTVTISNYYYDLNEKSVKVIMKIPGINKHKDKISLTASEFSFVFFVNELDGKNWSLKVSHLAHGIIHEEAKYNVTNKDKVVLLLPKKSCFEWTSLTPTNETVNEEWLDIVLQFFESQESENGVTYDHSIIMKLQDMWDTSRTIVVSEYLNLLNPSEKILKDKLFGSWFKGSPAWRTIDDVIIFAKEKIKESPFNCREALVLLGVAVLKKLIIRCKGTGAFKFVQIPEVGEVKDEGKILEPSISSASSETTDHSNYGQSNKSNELKTKNVPTKKVIQNICFNLPSVEVSFLLPEYFKTKLVSEKSVAERLAECLEERAQSHFNANNFTTSVEALTEVIELLPDRSHLYSNRAACYLKLLKFKDSLEDGLKAVHLDRSNIDGWLCVGESHFALGTSDESLEDLEKMLDETNNQKLKNLLSKFKKFSSVLSDASKAFELNDFEKAAKYYESASKVSDAAVIIKLRLSECYALSGQFDKAVTIADMLLKDKDSDATGYCILGMNFYYQNMKAAAFENFDKCLSIDDRHERCKELYKKARDIYFLKDRGNEYFNAKRYDLAYEMYDKGLNVDKNNKIMNAIINFNIGLTHLQQQKVADAISSFSIAIDLHRKYIKAFLKRAELYMEVKQFQDAVKDLETVCKIAPSPPHKKMLQEAKCKLKSQTQPPRNFCSLSEAEQNKILANCKKEKGNIQYKNQIYDEAKELYSEAIALDPDNPIHYLNRSACLMVKKNYKEALIDAEKSLELDGTCVKGYLRKGKIELILGKGEDALQTFNRGLTIESKDKSLKEQKVQASNLIRYISKGNEAYKNKKFHEASLWFKDALKIASNCSNLLTMKLESLVYCNQFDKVRLLLDKLEMDANYYYIYALLAYHNCNKEKALANIKKVLIAESSHPKATALKTKLQEAYHNWEEGIQAIKDSNYTKAQRFLERAIDLDPFNHLLTARVQCDLGDCFVKQEQCLKAISHFTLAIEAKNDMILPYLERAKCYSRLNKFEEAVKDFEKVYSLLPVQLHKNLLDEAKLKLKKSKRKDYYKILSVTPDASIDDIKRAYRRLAKEYHPDRHVAAKDKEEGEVKFKEINEAHNVLSDPLKRERYDRGEDLEDERDIFESFFTRAQSRGYANPFFPFFTGFSNFSRRSPSPDSYFSNYRRGYNSD